MFVQLTGTGDREGVNHVGLKSDGTLVLRYSDRKEFLDPDDYVTAEITEELA